MKVSGLAILAVFSFLTMAVKTAEAQPATVADTNAHAASFGHSLKNGPSKKRKTDLTGHSSAVPDESDVIRVETRLVVDDVLVTDKSGKAVLGLGRTDFDIYEDGVPQEIALFSQGNESAPMGRSIVLIIDYSGSERPYIEKSIDAAKLLIDGLDSHDRVSIVTDDVEVLTTFTTDRALLKEHLDNLKARSLAGNYGKSRQFSALMAALNELFDDTSLRPIVIFQTDGDEYASLKKYNRTTGQVMGGGGFTFNDLIETAERVRATVYSVIPNPSFIGISEDEEMERARADLAGAYIALTTKGAAVPSTKAPKFQKRSLKNWIESRKRDEGAIRHLAERTGGFAANIDTPEKAAEVYSRILLEFERRYLIGYYPADRQAAGERRRIDVKIRGRPGYTVWGKKEYFAPK